MAKRDLTDKVGRSYIEASDVEFRWRGAEYHLSIFRRIVEAEILGKDFDAPSQSVIDQMQWHLQAFYWEMAATCDTALQAVTAHHKLPIRRAEVRWGTVFDKVERACIECPLVEKLKDVHASNWFDEIRARRNNATHRQAIFIQAATVHGKVISLKAANQMMPVKQCTTYLRNMRELVDAAYATLPEGHISFSGCGP